MVRLMNIWCSPSDVMTTRWAPFSCMCWICLPLEETICFFNWFSKEIMICVWIWNLFAPADKHKLLFMSKYWFSVKSTSWCTFDLLAQQVSIGFPLCRNLKGKGMMSKSDPRMVVHLGFVGPGAENKPLFMLILHGEHLWIRPSKNHTYNFLGCYF